ncbi:MAG: endonuclease VIII [Thermoanaerobaculia bacterium]
MPEGPEIRRAADRVGAAVGGQIADDVFFAFARLKPFERQLIGQRVDEVTTRGKGMLTRFEGGLSVYTHNQLYGRWYVMRNDRLPKTGRQLRFVIRSGDRGALLYSASEIEVLDVEGERRHPYLSRLGPDVLSQSPTADDLAARLDEPRFRGRQLAALLLDQSFVAGLGNYLRAEILFEARIPPRRRAADCSAEERRRLGKRVIALTRRTYRTRGITLAPSRVAQLKAAGAPRSDYRFWVYGRGGEPCRVCGRRLEVESVGGRKCFWCPSCQLGRYSGPLRKGEG